MTGRWNDFSTVEHIEFNLSGLGGNADSAIRNEGEVSITVVDEGECEFYGAGNWESESSSDGITSALGAEWLDCDVVGSGGDVDVERGEFNVVVIGLVVALSLRESNVEVAAQTN